MLAALGLAGLFALTGQSAAQTFDRNDGNAVMLALRSAMGPNAQIYPPCIGMPPHFPDLVIARSLTPHSGCQLWGVLVRGRWQDAPNLDGAVLNRLAPDALLARGWREADSESRRMLAQQWVLEVMFTNPILDPASVPPNIQAPISPPESRTRPDGGVEVRLWAWRPQRVGSLPYPEVVIFGPDARPTRPQP